MMCLACKSLEDRDYALLFTSICPRPISVWHMLDAADEWIKVFVAVLVWGLYTGAAGEYGCTDYPLHISRMSGRAFLGRD